VGNGSRMRDIWNGLEPRGQLALVGSGLLVAVTLFALFQLSSRPSYVEVASGLAPAESGKVASALSGAGIQYKLRGGGTAVSVVRADVAAARVALAEQGLPRGGHVGFELLDKRGFGTTDFQRKVDYQRALEGEIARTVEAIDGVQGAEVQLVLTDKTLFLNDGTPASAAVLLTGGTQLDGAAVRGIAHLVASSVQGLDVKDVTITSGDGTLLWPEGDVVGGAGGLAKLEAESRYGAQLSAQVNALLVSTLGPGKGQARVHAELNLDQTKIDTVTYGKKGTPTQSKTEQETLASKGARTSSVAGVGSSVPGGASSGTGGQSDYKRKSDSTEFGVDRVVESRILAPGSVTRVDVALFFDSSVPAAVAAGLQKSVTSLVGLDRKRGDTLNVAKLAFAAPPKDKATAAAAAAGPLAALGGPLALARWAGLGILMLVFLFLARRGLKRREEDAVSEPTWLRQIEASVPLAQLEAASPARQPLELKRSEVGQQIEDIVKRQPEQVAKQVAAWMRE